MKLFKVLLVDDEPLITRGLEALVNWEDYGFEVTYISENGLDALQYIQEHEIDLLVTDIVMPKMTGLELIEEAKKVNPELKCIILSGYEEFDYVKRGIKLGIENYLVKPVDELELEQTVHSTSEKLLAANQKNHEEHEDVLKENTLWRLLNGEISKSEWEQRLSFYNIDRTQPYYSVTTLEFSNISGKNIYVETKQKIENEFNAYCVISPNQELIIILYADDAETLVEKNQQIAAFLNHECKDIGMFYMAMGDVVDMMEDIEDSYF